MTDYSRGDYADLPAGTTDLENNYTAPDLTAIASNDNSTYAEQTANNEIAIHQYKKTVTGQYTNITWSGKSSLAPSESPVIMEVYNVDLTAWEELDRDDSTAADTDFDIIYNNLATADYLDSGVITWRVYQAASAPPTLVWQSVVTGGTPWNWSSANANIPSESTDYAPPNSLKIYHASETSDTVLVKSGLGSLAGYAVEFQVTSDLSDYGGAFIFGDNIGADLVLYIFITISGGYTNVKVGVTDDASSWHWTSIYNLTNVAGTWKTIRAEVVCAASGTLKLFIDGVQQGTTTSISNNATKTLSVLRVNYGTATAIAYLAPVAVYSGIS